jgi:hypothetical protein
MADLSALLRRLNLTTATAADAAGVLNRKTVQQTNHKRQNAADMLRRFGAEKVMSWSTSIGHNGGAILVQTIAGSGVDFADPETVKVIQGLAQKGAITEQDAADMLAQGTWFVSPWEDAGGEGDVSEADVAAALVIIAVEDMKESLTQDLSHRVARAQAKINSGEITTQAAMVAALGE